MAIVRTNDAHYKNIAQKLRECLNNDRLEFTPDEMPDEIQNVYNAGVINGHTAGTEAGIAQGKQSAYDEFWNAFQRNGTLTSYNYAFAGNGWNATSFKPKYSMYPVRADCMFHTCPMKEDIQTIFDRQGIVLDTSNATSVGQMFAYSSITGCGEISTVKSADLSMMFYQDKFMKTIGKLILKSDGSQTFNNTFYLCEALENITIEGIIGNNFDAKHSTKLTKQSITSIINALSTTTSGKTLTLSQTAVINAFGSLDNAEFTALVGSRTNWTISTV